MEIDEAIRSIYRITRELEASYPGRHFTPDGHLIGSIGEVYASQRYGLTLFPASEKTHDGEDASGRLVQVKMTQRDRIGISEKPDFLIVLKVDERGSIEEVYNGPGNPVWSLVDTRPRPKNGQYQISLARLRELNVHVEQSDRIRPVH